MGPRAAWAAGAQEIRARTCLSRLHRAWGPADTFISDFWLQNC